MIGESHVCRVIYYGTTRDLEDQSTGTCFYDNLNGSCSSYTE
ncbi:hypothetical protein BN79_032 [Yersinia phage phiR2-01]|uniref:Uncharacterized protein n=1 Tax=Yersinia phage phiR2-01 TaxID=1206557 RepID=I7KQS7_9CAUD|nr:hypothetical protein BN79_032 [Yersinia phage phiR2-01]CCI88460.1 hypothetical protein BN79_032 [Yersinia phage phiR2-01]